MIFVDTGAWFALLVREDPDHPAAKAWIGGNTNALITTDYIIDELLTLLRMRSKFQVALRAGELLLSEEISRIAWVSPLDVHQGWEYFRDYQDKGWSFTDCVSRAVIRRLDIRRAFAFDKHFRQFGSLEVLP